MLRNMRFRYKIMSMPAVAALGFVLVLVTSLISRGRLVEVFERIQVGHVPAVELYDDLLDGLQQLRRQLQDAVAAEDPELVRATVETRDGMLSALDEATANPVLETGEVEAIREIGRAHV